MSLLFGPQKREFMGVTAGEEIGYANPNRYGGSTGTVRVNNNTALRHSAVWACLRLRANLISTFPIDVYAKVGDTRVNVKTPPVLINPDGDMWDIGAWMWASQVDLDRAGNAIGLITERDGQNYPSRIELQAIDKCSVLRRKGVLKYRIDGVEYPPEKVWHERQYPVAGLDVGLSPVAYAAWSIGEFMSIQDFALKWFSGGAVPKARMKNTNRKLKTPEIVEAKQWYRDVIQDGDLMVYGSDWEYDMIQAEQHGNAWIEARQYGLSEIARFFDCPADLIDAAVASKGTLTYANITQRNLQLLIMSIGPPVARREQALTKLTTRPRYVKLNTDALLRMDPETRAKYLKSMIDARLKTVSECRALDDLPPLTQAQIDEFEELFGAPGAAPAAAAPAAETPSPAPVGGE